MLGLSREEKFWCKTLGVTEKAWKEKKRQLEGNKFLSYLNKTIYRTKKILEKIGKRKENVESRLDDIELDISYIRKHADSNFKCLLERIELRETKDVEGHKEEFESLRKRIDFNLDFLLDKIDALEEKVVVKQ